MSKRKQGLAWLEEHGHRILELSEREGAKIMSKAGVAGAEATLRRAIRAFKNATEASPASKKEEEKSPDAPPKEAQGIVSHKNRHFYNKADDVYVFWLRCRKGNTDLIKGEFIREAKKRYSRWEESGREETINAIAKDFGWPRQLMVEIITELGWTHDQDPFTDEEHFENAHGERDLLQDLVMMSRAQLEREKKIKAWEETVKDAEMWRDMCETTITPMLIKLRASPIRTESPKISRSHGAYSVVMFPTDGHLDQKNADGTGFATNKEIWLGAHGDLLEQLRGLKKRPEFITLVLGSDQWNTDNMENSTTAGTMQDNDLLPLDAVPFVADAGVEAIEMCRAVAPVRVRILPGNHDWRSCLFYLWGLKQKYEEVADVQILGRGEAFQYDVYGTNLFGYHHGHGMSGGRGNSALKLTGRMAKEVPLCWGSTKNRYWFLGHLEHLWEHDDGSHVMQAMTTKKVDRWHDVKGYVMSARGQVCWCFSKDRGQTARLMSLVHDV